MEGGSATSNRAPDYAAGGTILGTCDPMSQKTGEKDRKKKAAPEVWTLEWKTCGLSLSIAGSYRSFEIAVRQYV
jgi:hypothetical protein